MALTNIVENAMFWVEFSSEPLKSIEIMSYGDDDKIYIEILDNGPAYLKKIWRMIFFSLRIFWQSVR